LKIETSGSINQSINQSNINQSPVLEMLNTAETFECSIHHYGDATAQRFTLFHAINRMHASTSGTDE
jgi:hypothetical protein